jgi:hypothetical protein
MIGSKQAKEIARTVDAYSRGRFTNVGWERIAARLAANGFTPEGITWVLTSKHMRWAADHARRDHSATADDFAVYVNAPESRLGWDKLKFEAQGTPVPAPKTGADLAGNCEGEDIAELIDLARAVSLGKDQTAKAALAILARIEARS